MKTAARIALFAFALILDSSRLLELPIAGGIHPLLFMALALVYALPSGAFAGGVWGFSGGLALGFLVGNPEAGAITLGGFLGATIPIFLRPLVFWRRWRGQAALGFLGAAVFNLTIIAVAALRRETGAISAAALVRVTADALLTGVACPLLALALRPMEKRD